MIKTLNDKVSFLEKENSSLLSQNHDLQTENERVKENHNHSLQIIQNSEKEISKLHSFQEEIGNLKESNSSLIAQNTDLFSRLRQATLQTSKDFILIQSLKKENETIPNLHVELKNVKFELSILTQQLEDQNSLFNSLPSRKRSFPESI